MLIRENEEVYYLGGNQNSLNKEHFLFLKEQSEKNKRSRCRICTHDSSDAALHEMFILHRRGNYIPPHRHFNSDESVIILEGEGSVSFFNEEGAVFDTIYVNAQSTCGSNYIRIPKAYFHSLYIASEYLIFKETILGPFKPDNAEQASWAPKDNTTEVEPFLEKAHQLFTQAKDECQRISKN